MSPFSRRGTLATAVLALVATASWAAPSGRAADLTKAPSFRAREASPNIDGLKHWALLIGVSLFGVGM